MENFKGTQGPLELKFIGGVCVGIGTIGPGVQQTTAMSVLPESDVQYDQEREEIIANMQLYATALEMLSALKEASGWLMMASLLDKSGHCKSQSDKLDELILKATTLPQ